MSVVRFIDAIKQRLRGTDAKLDQLSGAPQAVLFAGGEGGTPVLHDSPLKVTPAIVTSTQELEDTQWYATSFETVFNTWQRVSRHGVLARNDGKSPYSLSAIPDELDTWTYDAENDRIYNDTNSVGVVGFLSANSFDRYTIEAIVRSSGNDDDEIGFFIAVAFDNEGNCHTLELIRQLRGNAPMIVIKNRRVDDVNIGASRGGLYWSDGTLANYRMRDNYTKGRDPREGEERHPWWSNFPDGVLLKVVRDGDEVRCSTSDLFNPRAYVPDADIVLDLRRPNLSIFRNKAQWGFYASSQARSSWEMLQRPLDVDQIYHVVNQELMQWNGYAWDTTPVTNLEDLLTPGRFYLNQQGPTLYYMDPDDNTLFPMPLTARP